MKKRVLSKEDVLHLAKLSNLTLTEDEIEKFKNQLSEIVEYFTKLNEVDTSNVEPVGQITGLTNESTGDKINKNRMLSQKEALQNAKSKKDGFFKVKSIF